MTQGKFDFEEQVRKYILQFDHDLGTGNNSYTEALFLPQFC
jgi:hypothetical protein